MSKKDSSRRAFPRTATPGKLAYFLTAAGVELAAPHPFRAHSLLSSDAAIQELMDGNKRYTSGPLTSLDEDLGMVKQKTAEKQEPFA